MTIHPTPRTLLTTLAAALTLVAAAAWAQAPSYSSGSVWSLSHIKIEPGQGERYMDFLADQWKRLHDEGKRMGTVVSYHVLQVNDAREGEPDLILAVEYPDYLTHAQQAEMQKRIDAFLANDVRTREAESGARAAMRKLAGSMQLQELILKPGGDTR